MDIDLTKVNKSDTVVNGRASSPIYTDSDDDSLPEIECKLCKKSFLNVRSYEQHLNSKKHHNQMTKKKMASARKSLENMPLDDDNEKVNSEHTELHCETCSIAFSGYIPYVSHLRGSLHAKNIKKQHLREELKDEPDLNLEENEEDDLIPKPIARCSLCSKEFMSLESYKQHQDSSVHKKKLQQQRILGSLKAEYEGADGEPEDDFFKKCETCDKSFNSLQSYHIHMNSSIHQKALKRIDMEKSIEGLCTKDSTEKKFICNECQKPFTDPFSFQAHLDNNSHKKYEAKAKINNFVNANPDIVAGKTIQGVPSDLDDEESYRVGDYILLCKLCHMSFTGPESAVDHVKSKKHLKIKQEREKIKLLRQAQNTEKSGSKSRSSGKELQPNEQLKDERSTVLSNGSINNISANKVEQVDDFEVI